ncbi:MAG: hypothetical protein R2828_29735 [Saprospiraceae bacterium]
MQRQKISIKWGSYSSLDPKYEKKNKLMVPRLLLDKMGFHFHYCTGCYINNQGKLYYYIYNYAWMEFSTQELIWTFDAFGNPHFQARNGKSEVGKLRS